MADTNALSAQAGFGMDPNTLQALQEEAMQQRLGNFGGSPQDRMAAAAQMNGIFNISPEMQQQRAGQQAVQQVMASTPQDDGEDQIDYQMRLTQRARDALIATNPGAASQLNTKLLALKEAQLQQGLLKADSRMKNDQAQVLEDDEPLRKATKQIAYTVTQDPEQELGYKVQAFDLSTQDGNAAFNQARLVPNTTVMNQADASKLFNTANTGEMRLAAATARAQLDAGTPLDPDTLKTAAIQVAMNPTRMHDYASYGKSGQARRDQINAAVNQLMHDANISPWELEGIRASVRGEGASIQKTYAQLGAINSFDPLIRSNGNLILKLTEGVDITGVPAFEGVLRHAQAIGGHVDANLLKSTMNTFQREVARMLTNPNMTGSLTNAAVNDLKDIVGGNLDAPSMRAVIHRLFTEMDIRREGLTSNITDMRQGMGALFGQQTGLAPGELPPQAPPPAAPAAPPAAAAAPPAAAVPTATVPPPAQRKQRKPLSTFQGP